MTGSLEERLTVRAQTWNWYLLGGLTVASLLLWDLKFSLGVALGGLLATVNFHFLNRTVKRQFRPGHQASIVGVVGRYYLRFLATGVIILLLLMFNLVGPIGLLIGLSVVVLNLTLSGLLMARRAIAKEAL